MSQSLRTPMRQVRGLGSAKEGADHFIKQRVTAIALIFLVPWFLFSFALACQAGYSAAREWIASPINSILILLALGAAFYHMRLGMQVVIEDYIGRSGTRIALLLLNTFVAVAFFAAAAFSVLRISIGA